MIDIGRIALDAESVDKSISVFYYSSGGTIEIVYQWSIGNAIHRVCRVFSELEMERSAFGFDYENLQMMIYYDFNNSKSAVESPILDDAPKPPPTRLIWR